MHSYHRVGTRISGGYDAELRGVIRIDIHTVESVAEFSLVEHDLSLGGVGKKNISEDTLKGVTELHFSHGGQREGVMVDYQPGVVADPPQAAIFLGYDAGWVEVKPF